MEMANTRYDPFKLDLQGWSESFHENIDSMDEILEELYDKYYNQFMFSQMPVEARLISTIAFSALTFHFTKAYFTPERMRNINKTKQTKPVKPQQTSEMPGPSMDMDEELLDEWLRKQNSVPSMDALRKEDDNSPRNATHHTKIDV